MNESRLFSCLCLLATLSGCASNFDRGGVTAPRAMDQVLAEAFSEPRAEQPAVRQGDAEAHLARGFRPGGPSSSLPERVGPILSARPTLSVPGRLAVVEVGGRVERQHVPSWGSVEVAVEAPNWTVRPPSARLMRTLRLYLGRQPEPAWSEWPVAGGFRRAPFARIDPLPSMLLPEQARLTALRQAAARLGADALLVYATSTRVYTFRNGLANLYPTLLGLLLPGEETVVASRCEGALVSVRDGLVVAVAQGEGEWGESRNVFQEGRHSTQVLVQDVELTAASHMLNDLRMALVELEADGRFVPREQEDTK